MAKILSGKLIVFIELTLIVFLCCTLWYLNMLDSASNEELLGLDSNGNLIRDDVEEYIRTTYPDEALQISLLAGARIKTEIMLLAASTTSLDNGTRRQYSTDSFMASDCTSTFAETSEAGYKASSVVSEILFNEPARTKAYNTGHRKLGGGTYRLLKDTEAKRLCTSFFVRILGPSFDDSKF